MNRFTHTFVKEFAVGSRRGLPQGAIGLIAVAFVASACLDRPVALQQPATSNLNTQLYSSKVVDKIDLLFMIDNSASMADKQQILAKAVPDLVDRLVTPVCVDAKTKEVQKENGEEVFSVNGTCSTGNIPDFAPVKDIHIGVISSSLGGHGSAYCEVGGAGWNATQKDMSHLITRQLTKPDPVDTWAGKGFLDWDPTQTKSVPPGLADATLLKQRFQAIVEGTGQAGCGFEASLEAWYRFLVDPAPYASIIPVACRAGDPADSCRATDGVDATVIAQRKDFVRPDSLLATIMLSDENDCSVAEGGQSFLIGKFKYANGKDYHLPRATSVCDTDPNSPKCTSCGNGDPQDSNCQKGEYTTDEDNPNLRCYRQKQRFGFDLLYPTARYVEGLTKPNFADGTYNPVFCSSFKQKANGKYECDDILRDPNLVFLAGIVGVPWQNLAKDPSNLENGNYRPARELGLKAADFKDPKNPAPAGLGTDKTLWDILIGNPDKFVEPGDPLMSESIAPRSGNSPIVNAAVQPVNSPTLNPVNGTERTIVTDLQYACRFELPTVRDCPDPSACDCEDANNPLCRDPKTGAFDPKHQFYAKAYPGRRQLTVLKGLGEQAIVASICAAETTNVQSAIYGYRPAIRAIVDRLKLALSGKCWNEELQPDGNGAVDCVVIESKKLADGEACVCDASAFRADISVEAQAALEQTPAYIDNGLNCACQIDQVNAAGMPECTTNESDKIDGVNGWCYVDPLHGGSTSIVAKCPDNEKRMIRFVGGGVPAPKSKTFLQCKGT